MVPDEKNANRRFYDTERPTERARFEQEASKIDTARALVPWVVAHLPRGSTVLDIAGGAGTYASEIARRADATVLGVDISLAMCEQRGEDPATRLNAVGDMEYLPFANERFDAALFIACLHHLPDPRTALREAHRVMRPGGSLFILEPSSLRARKVGVLTTPLEHEFRLAAPWLARQVEECGMKIEEIRYRRITARALMKLRIPLPLWAHEVGNRLDDVLRLLPPLARLGSTVLIRAVRV
jgi:ubiquinone/menaquinone biosynthesis C-methylase UbiE